MISHAHFDGRPSDRMPGEASSLVQYVVRFHDGLRRPMYGKLLLPGSVARYVQGGIYAT